MTVYQLLTAYHLCSVFLFSFNDTTHIFLLQASVSPRDIYKKNTRPTGQSDSGCVVELEW